MEEIGSVLKLMAAALGRVLAVVAPSSHVSSTFVEGEMVHLVWLCPLMKARVFSKLDCYLC
jgi:hypothetical protein